MNFTKRQVEIIEASKDLIGTKGLQNLTIKNLAKKMNFSEPALYRHFKDKTDYIRAELETAKNSTSIQLRLKGDEIDHLSGEKWSLRIKSKKKKLCS